VAALGRRKGSLRIRGSDERHAPPTAATEPGEIRVARATLNAHVRDARPAATALVGGRSVELVASGAPNHGKSMLVFCSVIEQLD
jgi:hypothetical protein